MLLLFILYIPLLFLGFGTDSDTYTALNAWNHFLDSHVYQPSRLPGYVIHEMVTFYAVKIGDSVFSNFISLVFACLTCFFLIKIARHFQLPKAAILLVILNPAFIVNATSTVDYVWALFFFTAGLYLMIQQRILPASLLLAFASAIRLSYAFLLIVVFVVFLIQLLRDHDHRVEKLKTILLFLSGGILILVINFAAYYLPLKFTGWNLSIFLSASMGDKSMWSPLMRIGRWGYKNLLLWGIPSAIVLVFFVLLTIKKTTKYFLPKNRYFLLLLLLLACVVETLFLVYPIEIEYLLPLLPFAALLLGFWYRDKPKWIAALSVLILLNGFVAISIARPDVPNYATSASLEFRPVQGYLLTDITTRPKFEEKYHTADNWWYVQRLQRSDE